MGLQEVEMIQGRIVIDTDRCKGCELCVGVCPQDVIRVADGFNAKGYRPAQLVDPAGACTGCAVCALICPDTAITVYRQATQEPRTKNRESAGSVSGSQLALPVPALASTERRLS